MKRAPLILFLLSLAGSVFATIVEKYAGEIANPIYTLSGFGIFASAIWIFVRRMRKKKVEQSSNTNNSSPISH